MQTMGQACSILVQCPAMPCTVACSPRPQPDLLCETVESQLLGARGSLHHSLRDQVEMGSRLQDADPKPRWQLPVSSQLRCLAPRDILGLHAFGIRLSRSSQQGPSGLGRHGLDRMVLRQWPQHHLHELCQQRLPSHRPDTQQHKAPCLLVPGGSSQWLEQLP